MIAESALVEYFADNKWQRGVVLKATKADDGRTIYVVHRDGTRVSIDCSDTQVRTLAKQGWIAKPGILTDWTFWGQGQPTMYGTTPPTVSWAGRQAIQLVHPSGSTALHRKLYKGFHDYNWPLGTPDLNDHTKPSPADVSGRYYADVYVPSNMLPATWYQLAQFKEDWITIPGQENSWASEPAFWAGLTMQIDGIPRVNVCTPASIPHTPDSLALDFRPFLDKWVRVEYVVRQNIDTAFYVGGVLVDRILNSEFPAGVRRPVAQRRGWTFGVGCYGNVDNPPDINKTWGLYVAEAGLIPA